MEKFLQMKYDAVRETLRREHEAAIRPHKDAYDATMTMIDKAIYGQGATADERLRLIKQMRKPQKEAFDRYESATRKLVGEYDRKLNQAYRDYQAQLVEWKRAEAEALAEETA